MSGGNRYFDPDGLARIGNMELVARNRELQHFTFVGSHDLQEPLRKINSFADLLELEYAAELDEQITCTVTVVETDEMLDMMATVTAVNGDDVSMEFEFPDGPPAAE